jgi:hypothetical protein
LDGTASGSVSTGFFGGSVFFSEGFLTPDGIFLLSGFSAALE